MDELACAIANKKRVVFVRDAHATIPRLDSVEGVPGLVHIHKRLPELAEECLEALRMSFEDDGALVFEPSFCESFENMLREELGPSVSAYDFIQAQVHDPTRIRTLTLTLPGSGL